MPRFARQKNDNAIYHIMVRGNNRENMFFCDDDKVRYLETLKTYKEKFQMLIYAYCLMDNHVHLIIDCNGQDISKIMKGISLSYTQYVNKIYKRCGHLIQDRFKSEIIDTDEYILQASKYIHQNPMRANIVEKVSDYKWSSFNIYGGKRDAYDIIDNEFILKYFSDNKQKARKLYTEYVDKASEIYQPEVEQNKYENIDKKVNVKGDSMTSVINKVSTIFGICTHDITQKHNKRYAEIKQIALYLISLKSKITYKKIGQRFGICGSGVGKNIKKAVNLLMQDIEIKRYVELILQN